MNPGVLAVLLNGYDTDALAWRARVAANGGSVGPATMKAAGSLARALRASGLRTKIKRLNLFAGDQLAACLVPFYFDIGSAVETNVSFVAGDYTEATGLTGNGTTKRLNTGVAGTSLTKQDSHMAAYARATFTKSLCGARDGGTTNRFVIGQDTSIDGYSDSGGASAATDFTAGFHVYTANTSTLRRYRNGAAGPTNTAGSTMPSSANLMVFANGITPSAELYSSANIAAYSFGSGLTAAEVATYNTIMETFQDAMNRGVQ